ncbi:GDP-mannose 4,6-dehydratase [Streptomyces sp. NPDC001406]|uniref:GDP-mannose 4,6-dehydratase n=1 Tax=Streptomyces sp. NPDC001406 TaxID=3364572 RepID=UPI00367D7E0C
MPEKTALITGITGQDGSYLAELLLAKGYTVHGIVRRASKINTSRINHLDRDLHDPEMRLFLHYGDLTDGSRIACLLERVQPDEVYNLAAQSHARVPFREAYGLYTVNGILFNHESPRHGPTFVTRKVAVAAARIKAGLQDTLYLGNLDARRDWGYAAEYVEAMWLMLQQEEPRDHVRFDERCPRPSEVDDLVGAASEAARIMDRQPTVRTPELAGLVIDAELEALLGKGGPTEPAVPSPARRFETACRPTEEV